MELLGEIVEMDYPSIIESQQNLSLFRDGDRIQPGKAFDSIDAFQLHFIGHQMSLVDTQSRTEFDADFQLLEVDSLGIFSSESAVEFFSKTLHHSFAEVLALIRELGEDEGTRGQVLEPFGAIFHQGLFLLLPKQVLWIKGVDFFRVELQVFLVLEDHFHFPAEKIGSFEASGGLTCQ